MSVYTVDPILKPSKYTFFPSFKPSPLPYRRVFFRFFLKITDSAPITAREG